MGNLILALIEAAWWLMCCTEGEDPDEKGRGPP
jgi:hypothetical protein